MKFCLSLFLLCWPFWALADEGGTSWIVNEGESAVTFSVAVEGSPVVGEFTKFKAAITFDPVNLTESQAEVVFDLNHITASFEDVAENLKKESWFDVRQFPNAHFVSRTFRHLDDQAYEVLGDLTIRDVTAPAVLAFTLIRYDKDQAEIRGKMTISRRAFGVGQGPWDSVSMVADQVDLEVHIMTTRE